MTTPAESSRMNNDITDKWSLKYSPEAASHHFLRHTTSKATEPRARMAKSATCMFHSISVMCVCVCANRKAAQPANWLARLGQLHEGIKRNQRCATHSHTHTLRTNSRIKERMHHSRRREARKKKKKKRGSNWEKVRVRGAGNRGWVTKPCKPQQSSRVFGFEFCIKGGLKCNVMRRNCFHVLLDAPRSLPDTCNELLMLLGDEDVRQGLGQTLDVALGGVLLQHVKQLLFHIWILAQHFLHLRWAHKMTMKQSRDATPEAINTRSRDNPNWYSRRSVLIDGCQRGHIRKEKKWNKKSFFWTVWLLKLSPPPVKCLCQSKSSISITVAKVKGVVFISVGVLFTCALNFLSTFWDIFFFLTYLFFNLF